MSNNVNQLVPTVVMLDNRVEKVDKCLLNRGRYALFCIQLGPWKLPVMWSREVAAKQGFFEYYSE